jgi:hypothetical protein
MTGTAWAVSNNYFTNAAGKVVTQWPYSAVDYHLLLRVLGPFSETARRRARAPEVSSIPLPSTVT